MSVCECERGRGSTRGPARRHNSNMSVAAEYVKDEAGECLPCPRPGTGTGSWCCVAGEGVSLQVSLEGLIIRVSGLCHLPWMWWRAVWDLLLLCILTFLTYARQVLHVFRSHLVFLLNRYNVCLFPRPVLHPCVPAP